MISDRPATKLSEFLEKARQAGVSLGESARSTEEVQRLNQLPQAELTAALDGQRLLAEHDSSDRDRLTLGLIYPALVALLATVGAVLLSGFLAPVYASTYGQVHESPGPAAQRLGFLSRTGPLWLAVAPVAVVAGVWWARRELSVRRNSCGGRPMPASRRRLAKTCAEAAGRVARGEAPEASLASAGPLAAWAAQSGEAEDLRAVASVEADLAREGTERLTLYGPLVATVVVGGGATLLYALTLFAPLVELLGRLSP